MVMGNAFKREWSMISKAASAAPARLPEECGDAALESSASQDQRQFDVSEYGPAGE